MECPNCRQVEIGKWICGNDCEPNEDWDDGNILEGAPHDWDDGIGNILEGAPHDADVTLTLSMSVWDATQGILQTQPSSEHSPVPPVGLPAADIPGSNAPLLSSQENGNFHMHDNAVENHERHYPTFYRTFVSRQQLSARLAREEENNGRTGESIWAEPAFLRMNGWEEPPFSADEDHDGPGEPSE